MSTPIDGPRWIACADCGETDLLRHPHEHPDDPKFCLACWTRWNDNGAPRDKRAYVAQRRAAAER